MVQPYCRGSASPFVVVPPLLPLPLLHSNLCRFPCREMESKARTFQRKKSLPLEVRDATRCRTLSEPSILQREPVKRARSLYPRMPWFVGSWCLRTTPTILTNSTLGYPLVITIVLGCPKGLTRRIAVFIFPPWKARRRRNKENNQQLGNAVVIMESLCYAVSALVALPVFREAWSCSVLLDAVSG